MRILSVTILILLCYAFNTYAQKQEEVWIQGKSILFLGDSTIFIARDTVFLLPDSVSIFSKDDSTRRNSKFYKKIKKTLYKTEITAEIYNMLFDEPNNNTEKENSEPSHDNYSTVSEHIGKIIKQVRITKLAVFGTDIDDTTEFKNDSWIIRRANEIHNYTRESVIRNHLFFAQGDLLDPVKLEDSERILRSLPYIEDVRVLVEPVNDDEVNVVVVVKDNWSLYPAAAVYNINNWKLHLIEENFLGFGHQFKNELRYNNRYSRKFGYEGLYRIRNIGHSFITADFSFAESEKYTNRGVRIYRNYVVPEIQLAGGMEVSVNGRDVVRVLPDTLVNFDVKYQYQDIWLSHAYPIGAREKRKRLVTGARFTKYDFLQQPELRPDSNYYYFDRDQYFLNLGVSKRNYEKSSLIYGFGRTEDIPTGYLLSVTAGKEYSQFSDRWYAQFDYSIGGYLWTLGYFRPALTFGGFLRNDNIEQGMVKSELSYFSYLYYIRRFALRQFFYVNYTHGFNRFKSEFLDINHHDGIRGFRTVELLGTKKMVFRAETLAFTPLYLVGFRIAVFGFVDLAAIQTENKSLLDARVYKGFGLGFRFRNENLAVKSISLRLGFYPDAPADAGFYDTSMGHDVFLRPHDFAVIPPSVEDFR